MGKAKKPKPKVEPTEATEGEGEPHDEEIISLSNKGEAEQVEERWEEVVEHSLSAVRSRTGRDTKTMDEVFDKPTLMTLYKMISNGFLENLDYPISTGKEANVFHAKSPGDRSICVKIYRVNTATFHDMLPYIMGDPRFSGLKRDKRNLVQAWAQKEYRNLGRMLEAGARVPEPIACQENVLLMEFVGSEEHPGRLLKDTPPQTQEDAKRIHDRLLSDYVKMVRNAGLVHADFSEFNVLLDEKGEPVIIDCGQAVLTTHPMADEFIRRDANNFCRYFRKFGVKTTPEQFLKKCRWRQDDPAPPESREAKS